MATIEPRLMHLLNVNDSRDHLPSIHSTLGSQNNAEDGDVLLLPPLELNVSEGTSPTSLKQQQQQQQQQAALATTSASIYPLSIEDDQNYNSTGSGWPARAIRMASGDVSGADFSALPSSPDDPSLAGSASINGKRLRVIPHTDELIQLPQPLKKQKSNQQVGALSQVFPPIINGLHEPPPNAAVFPPIASDFDANATLGRGALTTDFVNGGEGGGGVGGNLGYEGLMTGATSASATETDRFGEPFLASGISSSAAGYTTAAPTLPSCAFNQGGITGDWAHGSSVSSSNTKPKRRAAKPRRRWTEEETNQLLIGVSRHGLGKWTAILEDPEFSFCNRSAGDLKDRFRTCCPDELRGKLNHADRLAAPNLPTTGPSTRARLKTKTSLTLEDILIEQDVQYDLHGQPPHPDVPIAESSSATGLEPKLRKRRVHRRNMEDMVKLGIQGPFKKSHRRERRPFTEQDDREILEGLQLYGPAWTKIHRHPQFNLSSRQPTDLRDRVRNKYPETYANIEKGVYQLQPQEVEQGDLNTGAGGTGSGSTANDSTIISGASTLLEPSVNTTMDNSRPSRPSLPSLLHVEPLESHEPSAFDIGEASSSAFLGNVGEMGISRLLLDDPQIPSYPM
ncbi:myb DNA-binding domain containing protein [Grosmannia clavigera kw1407]|uniref:Myb DNA-binding domain containing protein n=1 Tax=Grosmannia clavigera (strain kw1407 / UAMH 11150) TaxID=655863 RepID=F0XT88_GROCL|nr:myb DNA-binding domain containing protein [Grosmannia clavigera kw1407]EFW99183.1 myb DNA-binding domain containing protein [Grosmannia clavigera kw1407]